MIEGEGQVIETSLLLGLATILAVEISIRLPWQARFVRMEVLLKKIIALFRSRKTSDHFKEKLIPVYSFRLASNSALIAGYLFLLFLPYVGLLVFSTDPNSFLHEFIVPWNLGLMLVVSAAYLLLRAKLFK